MMVVIEISFLAVITFKLNSILKFHFDKVIHKIKVRINEEDLPAVLLHSALRYISKTVPKKKARRREENFQKLLIFSLEIIIQISNTMSLLNYFPIFRALFGLDALLNGSISPH